MGGILPFVILAVVMTKRVEVRIGVCRRHVVMRWAAVALALLGFLIGLGVMSYGMNIHATYVPILFVGVAMLVGSVVLGALAARIIWPKRIENGRAWVNGACPEYLDQLREFGG